jgi:hypothetical protein
MIWVVVLVLALRIVEQSEEEYDERVNGRKLLHEVVTGPRDESPVGISMSFRIYERRDRVDTLC